MYRRTGAYDGGGAPEMVDVQLITPAAVGGVLRPYRLTQPRANRRLLPGIAPQPAAQPAHGGGGGVSGGVGPAPPRRGRETHRPPPGARSTGFGRAPGRPPLRGAPREPR